MYEQVKVISWFLKLNFNIYVNLIPIMTYENVNLICYDKKEEYIEKFFILKR